MAHWIIEDHGFGGLYYKCSKCRGGWWDIFKKVSLEEKCPNCGVAIDEDETEYIDEKSARPTLSKSTVVSTLRAYSEMEIALINLTGYNVEKLVNLFAAGYTLQPPKQSSFEDLEKETE